jgi:hypothetical protein
MVSTHLSTSLQRHPRSERFSQRIVGTPVFAGRPFADTVTTFFD